MRVISFGGGVQSTALLVLAATGEIEADAALFANVGDDSEHPATLDYVRNIAAPYGAAHGVPVHELRRTKRSGETETLVGRINTSKKSIPIPVRLEGSGAPGNRSCTGDFKIRVVSRWIRENGATPADPARVLIGISTDEFGRASNRQRVKREIAEYPLLDIGLSRNDCRSIIDAAGLPIPPKSACFFCPYKARAEWPRMRRDEPELFAQAVEIEQTLSERGVELGRGRVFLSATMRPLDEIDEAQQTLPGLDGPESCDSGYCWT